MRGADVFVVQSHFEPINKAIMEQVYHHRCDEARERQAHHRGGAVLGYFRQDEETLSREPVSAKLVADMLRVAGADRTCRSTCTPARSRATSDGPFDHLTACRSLTSTS